MSGLRGLPGVTGPAGCDATPPGRRWPVPLLVFAAAFCVLCARRPDALLTPQFWGEDGACFYEQAYHARGENPMVPFRIPIAGYLHTTSRLVAAAEQRVPLGKAPLVGALLALAIQALVPAFVVSRRLAGLVPSGSARLLLGCALVVLPNCQELHANVTSSQWYLALLAGLVLAAGPSGSRGGGGD